MRTAFIFLVTMTAPTYESAAEIRVEWTQLTAAQPMGRVNALESDGHRLYAGTWNGVYISHDDGYTWGSTEVKHTCTSIAIHQDIVYAGTHGDGVVRSDNLGETWKPINNGLPRYEEVDQYGRIEQILVTGSGSVITVTSLGTYRSTDRGETWHGVIDDWIVRQDAWGAPDLPIARSILSMTEFDGYLWGEADGGMFRSRDNGRTWASVSRFGHHPAHDWAAFNDQLYVAGGRGFARWNEEGLPFAWDYRIAGLPSDSDGYLEYAPSLTSLAVNRGRLFAGLYDHGVYMFDARSDTWIPAGLQWLTVSALVSHRSELYAATYALHERRAGTVHTPQGIYRAAIRSVLPHDKAIATWGAIKRQ
ncbi:MAG: PQQ-binding-like beta-propeller repeat protein [Candidatus Poribacteria bacterium]|nr:PQQ-binding-like beta-propeller repeat protein [Candidatus Poribacteria bacterium]